jgi:tRNA(Ile)-lysidine synthase
MPRPTAPAAEHDALRPAQLFAGLAGARGIVAAVSGGADSTALMVLLGGWAERPPVLVVSVDHGLRPEAAEETRLVAQNAAALGLPARTMRAVPRPPTGNLQDWARRVRYTLLA